MPFDARFSTSGRLIKSWTRGVPVESAVLSQFENLAALPFVYKHIAIMPDVHLGKGATVGSVVATSGAVVPAAVGVDIGCGMMAVRTNLTACDMPDNLSGIRSSIEAAVPHGRTNNGGPGDRGAWETPPDASVGAFDKLSSALAAIGRDHPKLGKSIARAPAHMGTLGTGNHFVEVCLDQEDRVWVMLHSGSRGIGNAIGTYFIERAKEQMRRWFINLPDADLAYLPEATEDYRQYMRAVGWAQTYARANRETMMRATLAAVAKELGRAIDSDTYAVNCHHNYVATENHFGADVLVTRKGAVRAGKDEYGIIPGSMGAKSFIVRGKGNPDSFQSCSHGAGRKMSRNEARKRFTVADHVAATVGVECRKDAEVIDETPGAYKDIDAVMAAQTDLIDIVFTL
jgi:tRNA-splicing ligase RtcB